MQVAPAEPQRPHLAPRTDGVTTVRKNSRSSEREFDPEPDYSGKALMVLTAEHPIRAAAISFVDWEFFDKIVITIILVNCAFLAAWDPLDDPDSAKNQVLDFAEIVFQVLFSIEMAVKLVARGVIRGKTSYFRDGWNRLDAIVVISGWIGIASSSGSLSSLRVLRVLRPLRTISGIPGLRAIVSALVESVPQLIDVMLLCSFSFFIFGIVGIQFYSGRLQQHCCHDEYGCEYEEICSRNSNLGRQCPEGWQCEVAGHAPNSGYTSFDNIGAATLTIFQCITLEGWVDVMYYTRDSGSQWSDLYFVALIWFGSLFVLNLLVAVIYSNFNNKQPDVVNNPWFRSIEDQARSKPSVLSTTARRLSASAVGGLRRSFSKRGSLLLNEPQRDPVSTLSMLQQMQIASRGLGGASFDEDSEQEQGQAQHNQSAGINTGEAEDVRGAEVAVSSRCARSRRVLHLATRRVARTLYHAWRWLHKRCKHVVHSKRFQLVVTSMIIANTVILSIEHYQQPEWYTQRLEKANYFFAFAFFVEMILKWIGLGLKKYCKDPFNSFDMLVVFISFVELSLGDGGGISALRAFRLLRVFKLARSWRSLQRLLHHMGKSLKATGPFMIVLLLFMFIFALLGMQLFGARLADELDNYGDMREPRSNYNSLMWSLVTTFQIFTGENWTTVMYQAMDATTPYAAFYFVLVICIGTYIILSLFLAILIDNFARDEPAAKKKSNAFTPTFAFQAVLTHAPSAISSMRSHVRRLSSAVAPTMRTTFSFHSKSSSEISSQSLDEVRESGAVVYHPPLAAITDEGEERSRNRSSASRDRASSSSSSSSSDADEEDDEYQNASGSEHISYMDDDEGPITVQNAEEAEKVVIKTRRDLQLEMKELVCRSSSLCGLKASNPIRRAALFIVFHSWFETLMLTCIFLSCVLLAADEPQSPFSEGVKDALDTVDLVFNLFFVAELIVKIVALGLYKHEGSYLSDPWNRLDGFIVIAWLGNLLVGQDGGAVGALRALRALRPLRLVHRLPGLKVVINAMLKALPPCGNVAVVALLFFLVFGIMGYYFFGGKFYRCTDPSRTCYPHTIGMTKPCPEELWCTGEWFDYDVNATVARRWENPRYADTGEEFSFDNVAYAMLTLFEVSTLEMWLDVMWNAVDVTKLGHAPRRNANQVAVGFFLLFIAVVNFFILNLFVSVVIENFDKIKKESHGLSAFMTEEQKEWVRLHRRIRKGDPIEAEVEVKQSRLHSFVTGTFFELFIMGAILLNIMVLASTHYDQAPVWDDIQETANTGFSILFLAEAILKIYALGWKRYWWSSWNRFDLSIVVANTSIQVFNFLFADIGVNLSMLRIVRVGRVLRLAHSARSLRALLQTLYYSLPSLGNVGSLLFLSFFIYTIAGMALFGDMPRGEFVNRNANFETFTMSMLTLFRMTTGESWNAIMHDCQKHAPIASIPYFVSFMLLASSIMLNLFVAVILENFDDSSSEEEKPRVGGDDLKHFNAVWVQLRQRGQKDLPELSRLSFSESGHAHPPVDHSADPHYMPVHCLKDLVVSLSPPIGLDESLEYSHGQLLRVVKILGIPMTRDGYVHFYDTLASLAVRLFPNADSQIQPHTSDSDFTVDSLLAAVIIESAWRRSRHRRAVEEGRIPPSVMGLTRAEKLLNASTQLVDENAVVDPLLLESMARKEHNSPAGGGPRPARELKDARPTAAADLLPTLALRTPESGVVSSAFENGRLGQASSLVANQDEGKGGPPVASVSAAAPVVGEKMTGPPRALAALPPGATMAAAPAAPASGGGAPAALSHGPPVGLSAPAEGNEALQTTKPLPVIPGKSTLSRASSLDSGAPEVRAASALPPIALSRPGSKRTSPLVLPPLQQASPPPLNL